MLVPDLEAMVAEEPLREGGGGCSPWRCTARSRPAP